MYKLGESSQDTQIQHFHFFYLATNRVVLLNYVNALMLCCAMHNLEV